MGTPKLERIKVSERTKLLLGAAMVASGFYKEDPIKSGGYMRMLEEFRKKIHPMVEWIDAPLSRWMPKEHLEISLGRYKMRGALLIDGSGHGHSSVAMDRAGAWIVWGWRDNMPFINLEVDSKKLIEYLIDRLKPYKWFCVYFDGANFKRLSFLQKIICHLRFMELLRLMNEGVRKLIKAKKERLELIEDSLDFFDECIQAFDPVEHRSRPVKIADFSVFAETEHGHHRRSAGYFLKSEAEKVLAKFASREERTDLFILDGSSEVRSLTDFLFHLEIKAGSIKPNQSESGDTRGELTNEEFDLLKSLALELCAPSDFLKSI